MLLPLPACIIKEDNVRYSYIESRLSTLQRFNRPGLKNKHEFATAA